MKHKWVDPGIAHSKVWYLITGQRCGQNTDPLREKQTLSLDLCYLLNMAKLVTAILTPMHYLLYIRLISAAWFICAPAVSMKWEATEWNNCSSALRMTLFPFTLFIMTWNSLKAVETPVLCQLKPIRLIYKESLLRNSQTPFMQQLFRNLQLIDTRTGISEHSS